MQVTAQFYGSSMSRFALTFFPTEITTQTILHDFHTETEIAGSAAPNTPNVVSSSLNQKSSLLLTFHCIFLHTPQFPPLNSHFIPTHSVPHTFQKMAESSCISV